MKKLIVSWNWPKTKLDPTELNFIGYHVKERQDYEFCVLANTEEKIGPRDLNKSLVDHYILSNPLTIDPLESSIFRYGVKNIRPSLRENTLGNDQIVFCDRISKYPWTKDIVKRISSALDVAVKESHPYIGFLSGGFIPASENPMVDLFAIVDSYETKGKEIVVFRDVNNNIIPDFFIFQTSFLKRMLSGVTFGKNGSYETEFANLGIEDFLDLCCSKSMSSEILPDSIIEKIGKWERQEFSISLDDKESTPEEKAHVLKSLSTNSIFLSRNSEGNFDVGHVFCNLSGKRLSFEIDLTVFENHPGEAGNIIPIHQEKSTMDTNDWHSWAKICEVRPSQYSYIEVHAKTWYGDLVCTEHYQIPLKFEDLHAFSGLKYYYLKS